MVLNRCCVSAAAASAVPAAAEVLIAPSAPTPLIHYPSCYGQLGQQQSPSISLGPEPESSRCPMTVPWLLPLPLLSSSR
ncbi:hypothetical protein ElyMa_006777100 [Elysia marginata]|uniref:Secreted protein n=1 Tax=Elysia marginata TaxID=1093978 RepID=A0AAV4J3Z2_9GAST|nr:hypothetical protein ElyMa_006777100 [Elysia marginata]